MPACRPKCSESINIILLFFILLYWRRVFCALAVKEKFKMSLLVQYRDIWRFGAIGSTLAFVLAAIYLWRYRNRKFPPGPVGFPIVGYLPFLTESAPQRMAELGKKYGPVYSLKLGSQRTVVLCDYNTIYDALVRQSSVFSGRRLPEMYHGFGSNQGIIGQDYGKKWKNLRKFGSLALKGFGVGKRSVEDRVNEEARYLLEVIQSKQGEAFDPRMILSNAVANIICSILTGQRYDYHDETFKYHLRLLCERFSGEKTAQRLNVMRSFLILKYCPGFKKAYQSMANQVIFSKKMFNDVIAEHQKTHDPNDIRDFIDAFLVEMNRDRFTRENLDATIHDLFIAGTETTTNLLRWCLLYLATHPEVQERLRSEIILTCGTSGAISMDHRVAMPATCSYIHEVQRTKPILPLIRRKTNEETQLKGFTIPKDTNILVNIWQVHHDPKNFEKPFQFQPERFLDESGKFAKHDCVIPYSLGARYCLGMHLAEMEAFHFLTGILRNFQVVQHKDHPLPSFSEYLSGLVMSSLPYKVSFIPTS